ncbi:hypothetical protein [Haloferax volcanii]|uniref:DUF8124 domain-containing protein n=3 Tax=Haloferax volcanii TaxID=2246 RepID=A0A384KPV1_HALVD|nr:hypothetical protein [Haloferax volcanii]ADE02733.1 uncharacterized protein HVO_2933 [Haloferax volcanii DS2]ELY24543.1 hypothetical protein C498_17850 [Haloferax volcanii DS2]MBS8121131.1 hypothetical protein [Haloferax volcanii]MBS8126142.1 hypothetical protein [Haloferax volcanii]MBS8129996.1 hypothetical protein [Haloferax volcanii]
MTDPDETASEPASASTADSGAATTDSSTDGATDADTFRVGIHVTETELRFVVNVPSDIDSGWTDPDAFQRLVERVTWEQLDQRATLQTVATNAAEGETMFLGTVTLRPDETVVDHTLRVPPLDGA